MPRKKHSDLKENTHKEPPASGTRRAKRKRAEVTTDTLVSMEGLTQLGATRQGPREPQPNTGSSSDPDSHSTDDTDDTALFEEALGDVLNDLTNGPPAPATHPPLSGDQENGNISNADLIKTILELHNVETQLAPLETVRAYVNATRRENEAPPASPARSAAADSQSSLHALTFSPDTQADILASFLDSPPAETTNPDSTTDDNKKDAEPTTPTRPPAGQTGSPSEAYAISPGMLAALVRATQQDHEAATHP